MAADARRVRVLTMAKSLNELCEGTEIDGLKMWFYLPREFARCHHSLTADRVAAIGSNKGGIPERVEHQKTPC